MTSVVANSFYKWDVPSSCKHFVPKEDLSIKKETLVKAKGKELKNWP
jgi:hypothetical protein